DLGTGGGGSWIYGDGSDGELIVPVASRDITDAVLTVGSTTLTSDTADFTSDDLHTLVDVSVSDFHLAVGTIVTINSPTSVELSRPSDVSTSSATIGSNRVPTGWRWTDVTVVEGATFTISPLLYPITGIAADAFGEDWKVPSVMMVGT